MADEETKVEEEEVDEVKTESADDETEADAEGTATEEEKTEDAPAEEDDGMVKLPSGDKVTYAELLSGYMKEADYRKKTMELADMKRALNSTQERQVPDRTKTETKPEADDFLSKFDREQVDQFKKLAKTLGFVTSEELTVHEAKSTKEKMFNNFFAEHPEYSKDQDKDDMKFNALMNEMSLYDTADVNKLSKILERAHATVSHGFQAPIERAKALAHKERLKAASTGSGASSSGASKVETDKYNTDQLAVMKKMGLLDE